MWGTPDGLGPFTGMLSDGRGAKVRLAGEELSKF